ncbi:MAG: hypothetical protein JWO85_830 [Candidatus Eremiobacteraeota bacterium]|jgi:uncharacterized protein GlcG (DUF336 family)|nr:hypothetical protein [Candidatus Eremiobacteraeota bacterium]
MFRRALILTVAVIAFQPFPVTAAVPNSPVMPCGIPEQTIRNVQGQLAEVANLNNGGLFQPSQMWSAVVDRDGKVCSVLANSLDAWPGSRAIALAKAFTANGFSNHVLAFSTTMLYQATQPGGSLWGLNESNPFNPAALQTNALTNAIVGGIITFGGGVALYSGGAVIGGLGLSGDTSCADHVIAYRMRKRAHLDGIPTGKVPSDNISYIGGPVTAGQPFLQPHCLPSDIAPANI